jgi:hypothetical protein
MRTPIPVKTAWRAHRLLVLSLGFLIGFQLVLTNYLSTLGSRLTAINDKIDTLERENTGIEDRIGHQTSLGWISSQGQGLGLAKPKKVVFSTPPETVALRP